MRCLLTLTASVLLACLCISTFAQEQHYGGKDVEKMKRELEDVGIGPAQAQRIAGVTVVWMQRVMGKVEKRLGEWEPEGERTPWWAYTGVFGCLVGGALVGVLLANLVIRTRPLITGK